MQINTHVNVLSQASKRTKKKKSIQCSGTTNSEKIKKKRQNVQNSTQDEEKKNLSIPLPFCPMAALYPLQSVSALDQKLGNVFIKSTAEKNLTRKTKYIKFDVK